MADAHLADPAVNWDGDLATLTFGQLEAPRAALARGIGAMVLNQQDPWRPQRQQRAPLAELYAEILQAIDRWWSTRPTGEGPSMNPSVPAGRAACETLREAIAGLERRT